MVNAKVSKCQALAIKGSTGRVYDPKLSKAGGEMSFVGINPVRFLGSTIQVPHNPTSATKEKLSTLLQWVDAALVTHKQKLKLFHLAVCPQLSWDITIGCFVVREDTRPHGDSEEVGKTSRPS